MQFKESILTFEQGKEDIPFARVSSMTGRPNSWKGNFKKIKSDALL